MNRIASLGALATLLALTTPALAQEVNESPVSAAEAGVDELRTALDNARRWSRIVALLCSSIPSQLGNEDGPAPLTCRTVFEVPESLTASVLGSAEEDIACVTDRLLAAAGEEGWSCFSRRWEPVFEDHLLEVVERSRAAWLAGQQETVELVFRHSAGHGTSGMGDAQSTTSGLSVEPTGDTSTDG